MKKHHLPKRILAVAVLAAVSLSAAGCSGSPGASSAQYGATIVSSDLSSNVSSGVSSNISGSVSSSISSDMSSGVASTVPSDVPSNVSSTATGDVITFQQALGLTAPQIREVSIFFGGCTVTTGDPQKISALMDSLKDVKLKDVGPRQDTLGDGYIFDFYPKEGKGYKRYYGFSRFSAADGYTGPTLRDEYQPVDFDGTVQIFQDIYVSLGGKP